MNIFGWIVFALINCIILFSLDRNSQKDGQFGSLILGISSALSGSLFAYLVIKGFSKEFTLTFLLVVMMEVLLMMLLFFSKTLKSKI